MAAAPLDLFLLFLFTSSSTTSCKRQVNPPQQPDQTTGFFAAFVAEMLEKKLPFFGSFSYTSSCSSPVLGFGSSFGSKLFSSSSSLHLFAKTRLLLPSLDQGKGLGF